MTSTFSPNLNLELIGTGDDSGTWGTVLNNNVFSVLDSAIGSTLSLALASSNVTLTTSQTQNAVISLTGTLSANITITIPDIGRIYFVVNGTSGAFTVTFKTSAGATAQVQQGTAGFIIVNGSSGVTLAPNVSGPSSAVSGNLPMFSGTTGKVLVDSGTLPPVIATQAQAQAGTDNTVYITPLRNAQQQTARIASQAQAQAGSDNTTWMTPLRVAQAIDVQACAFPATSTDPNLTNFPIGTIITVSGNVNRNAGSPIYIDASDPSLYRMTSNGGAQLSGVWRARGRVASSSGCLFQRIA